MVFNYQCCMSCTDNDNNEGDVDRRSLNNERNSKTKDYESLDYDTCSNQLFRDHLNEKHIKWKWNKEILSWLSIFIIGVLTALVAFFIDFVVKNLTHVKLMLVSNCMDMGKQYWALPLLILCAFNLVFVAVAAFLVVFGEPLAAGSGIPEIKCYLNGVKVQNVTRFKTLICKALGVLFSVSGGLLVGKEGPMIHSGGIIGGGVPQFKGVTYGKMDLDVKYFRSDRDKRDFVSAGAAAGVAAAFGAPIGGVLFSLEEGASFWNQALTWKTLFCTMTSTFTLNFFLSGVYDNSWGTFNQNGLLTFGTFECSSNQRGCQLWTITDLFIFILMGVGGGIFGLTFNFINSKLTVLRLKYLSKMSKDHQKKPIHVLKELKF